MWALCFVAQEGSGEEQALLLSQQLAHFSAEELHCNGKKYKGRFLKSRKLTHGCNVSLQARVFFLHNGVSEIISIS